MILPELDLQLVYGKLAWTVVLAAVATALWPRAWTVPRRALGCVTGALAALMLLPGAASPAYWLALAFQWPSALLVGLCLVSLASVWRGGPPQLWLPPALGALLAAGGAALYLDAVGVLSQGFYFWGFGEVQAPLASLVLLGACAWAALMNLARPQAVALLGALAAYAVCRLPTGNLWDAVLDPLLWGWALACSALRLRRALNRRRDASSFAAAPDLGRAPG